MNQKKNEKKKGEADVEIRIKFFHFAPEISFNTEFFYLEIMKFSLKIHKVLVCQNM